MPPGDNAIKAFCKHLEKYVELDIHSNVTFSGDIKLALKEMGLLVGLYYIKPPSLLLVVGIYSNQCAYLAMYDALFLL